jgi:PhnB protein
MTTRVTPYLTVHDGNAALAFYATAFGAVESQRVVMDDGRLGHAEFLLGSVTFFLSDEFPEMGVTSPRTLGGTTTALHLEVADVDTAFARAVAAGATSVMDPADQPHGARHGTLIDPFGHRWMLSQQIETVSLDELAARFGAGGMNLVVGPGAVVAAAPTTPNGGIWAALNYANAEAGVRYLVEVYGFEPQLVVPGEGPGEIAHSQLRWPEGGVVQAASATREDNVFAARPTGAESLYVITADPLAVYRRCVDAAADVVLEPMAPDYDPDGLVFTVRDPEGNLWSFGTYAGESSTS